MNSRRVLSCILSIFLFLGLSNNLIAKKELSSVEQLEKVSQEAQQIQQEFAGYGSQDISLEQTDLKDLLSTIIGQRENPPKGLLDCYQKLNQPGVSSLKLAEILPIIPELIEFAKEAREENTTTRTVGSDRAPRPGSPTANNAVVGNSCCDLTSVLGLLSTIKKQIKNLNTNLNDCCTTIYDNFNETWTILDNITATATVDLSEVFTILEGIDTDLNDCCTTIFNNFNETWTILEECCDPCNTAIPISGPTTISSPGSYCLTQDISGGITDQIIINANRVFLDLNEKQITGDENAIKIVTGNSDIEIRNGLIMSATGNGIEVTGAENVSIVDIDFIANATGLFIETSTSVNIENCDFRQHTRGAIAVQDSDTISMHTIKTVRNINGSGAPFGSMNVIEIARTNNVSITDWIATKNSAILALTVLSVVNSDNARIEHATITDNITPSGEFNGIVFNTVIDALVDHCLSSDNRSAGGDVNGFNVQTAGTKVIFESCIANDNTSSTNTAATGFKLDSSSYCCVLNCLAKRNGTSSSQAGSEGNGFYLLDCSECLVENNTAIKNYKGGGGLGSGFKIKTGGTGTLQNSIFGNKSQEHGSTNYVVYPGEILRVVYTQSTTPPFISAIPTPLDNLDIN